MDTAPRSTRSIYGVEISPSPYKQARSVIGAPETAPAGNLVLRVGREHVPFGGWEQTEHVVMRPDEARAFAEAILNAVAES